MSDPKPQLLLSRRPIICTRCMHGHQVEVITGRENTPVEYHCAGCGNYAIVGVPARWPFMEVTKVEKRPDIGIPISAKHNSTGTSPLQTGEKIRQEARMVTEKALRKAGITKEQYKANKLWKTESVTSVATRVKGTTVVAEDIPFEPRPAKEAKPPEQEKIHLFQIFLDPRLLEKLTARAKAEYRTPEQQAAYILHKELSA